MRASLRKTAYVLIALLLAAPCSAAMSEGFSPADELYLLKYELELHGGLTFVMNTTVRPRSADENVVFTSSNPEIASVSHDGIITAHNEGEALIKAASADRGVVDYCAVTVLSDALYNENGFRVRRSAVEGNVYDVTEQLGGHEERAIEKYLAALPVNPGTFIVRRAAEYLGTEYKYVDCSSLTRAVCLYSGRDIGPRADWQAERIIMNARELDSLAPGDLLFFRYSADRKRPCSCGETCTRYLKIHHVGIYAGNIDGDDYMIDASSSIGKVVIRRISLPGGYSGMEFVAAARAITR